MEAQKGGKMKPANSLNCRRNDIPPQKLTMKKTSQNFVIYKLFKLVFASTSFLFNFPPFKTLLKGAPANDPSY